MMTRNGNGVLALPLLLGELFSGDERCKTCDSEVLKSPDENDCHRNLFLWLLTPVTVLRNSLRLKIMTGYWSSQTSSTKV